MSELTTTSPRTGVRILRKVLVSGVIGGMAYAITELTGQPEIWSITLSVFIGGVTLVVQFLVEFEARLASVERAKARHSARIEQMVEDGFAKINEATELFSLVEASALRTDAVIQLVRRATLIEPTVPPLVSKLAQAEIARVSDVLKELSEAGNVMYAGEDRDWLLALTQHTQSSIDATSLSTVDAVRTGFSDGGFWNSDLGQRYLELQRSAVQRGVSIRRVFILPDPTDPAASSGLGDICQVHAGCGIEVRVLDSASTPSTLRDVMFDFVLFDGVISYEPTPASQLGQAAVPMILNTRLELRADWVKTRIERFRQLWEAAYAFP